MAKNIRTIDMALIDELFRMGGGYVLDFSDRTFAGFFADDLNIDIDDPRYAQEGTSKAKRLRYFLQNVEKPTVVRVLHALWDYREARRAAAGEADWVGNAPGRFLELIARLEGKAVSSGPTGGPAQSPIPAFDRGHFADLKGKLIELNNLEPQARGYAFERFLKLLFTAHNLAARDPFRLQGEQIDGSFVLANEVYLLEAKWQSLPIGANELHAFHGKLDQKAAWTRGLFVSHSGYSVDGIEAFGRGKRVICMDGLDLYDALEREIPIDRVLEQKVRKASETGRPFIRVRELFP